MMAEAGMYFNVDANGKRIKTDILVSGYIRNHINACNCFIPQEIKAICFAYWFVVACDIWDKQSSSKYIRIDDEIAKCQKAGTSSIYGSYGINDGAYSWRIRLKKEIKWLCIGVIKDNPEILKQFKQSIAYADSYHGCYLSHSGKFYNAYTRIYNYGDNPGAEYCESFRNKDTIITMTLNMDSRTLSYKINDKDYGTASNELEKDKYRLVVNMCWLNDTIELL